MIAREPIKKASKPRNAASINRTEPAASPQSPAQPTDVVVSTEPIRDEPQRDRSAIEAEIRAQAYDIYLARGRTQGDDLLDWLEAERIVLYRRRLGG
jgi:hypothetical protein